MCSSGCERAKKTKATCMGQAGNILLASVERKLKAALQLDAKANACVSPALAGQRKDYEFVSIQGYKVRSWLNVKK